MSAATRERTIGIMAAIMLVLVISIGFLVPKAAAHRAPQFPVLTSYPSKEPSQAKGLPTILVFAVEVAKWSDGGTHALAEGYDHFILSTC
jgi:hypothetical protein